MSRSGFQRRLRSAVSKNSMYARYICSRARGETLMTHSLNGGGSRGARGVAADERGGIGHRAHLGELVVRQPDPELVLEVRRHLDRAHRIHAEARQRRVHRELVEPEM